MRYSRSMAVTSRRPTHKQSHRKKTRKGRLSLTILKRVVHQGWWGFRSIMKALMAAPPLIRVIIIPSFLLVGWLSLNWAFHAFNKPTEIFFPLEDSLNK